MSKFEPCPGATSDHAWRSIAVDLLDKSGKSLLQVQGSTWNMQAKCESSEANERRSEGRWDPHGNNPLNIDETDEEYDVRKALQRKELEKIMSSDHDFVFLQEPDWLRYPTLKAHFQALLAKQGWGMVVTKGKEYQMLVTLYNRQTLTPIQGSEQGRFISSYQKFRGFQVDFVHNATGREISLVNLHLEFGKDYRSQMLNLQKQMVQENKPCIMGGDTNNVQNMQLTTMLGDWNAATCVESNGKGGLTTRHQTMSGQPIQKTYDGFFVNPGLNTRVHITDNGGMCFKDSGDGQVDYIKYKPIAHNHYMSNFGEPWQRRKAIQSTSEESPHQLKYGMNKANSEHTLGLPKSMAPTMMYIQGGVNLDTYQQAYRDEQSRINKKIVFVFPGNPGHHTPGTTMFTIKGGSGLGVSAKEIGRAGFPVLSLPTTGMEGWANREDNQYKILSNQAVSDLYKAIAQGYSLMIPVRRHANSTYFDAPLAHTADKEPSFWGGEQKAANKPLANEYTLHLNNLKRFTDELHSLGEDKAVDNLRQYSPYFANVYVTARPARLQTSSKASLPELAPTRSAPHSNRQADLEFRSKSSKDKVVRLRKNQQNVTVNALAKNSGLALALLASSVAICALSIVALVMLPGPVGLGLWLSGLLVSAGMFGAGLHFLHENQNRPSASAHPQHYSNRGA